VRPFNLYRRVVDSKLCSQQILGLPQHRIRTRRDDVAVRVQCRALHQQMHRERGFPQTQVPNMQIVNLSDIDQLFERPRDLHIVQTGRHRLHEHRQDIAHQIDRGEHDDDAKDQSADRVRDSKPLLIVPDQSRCDHHPDRLQQISQSVDEGRSHIDLRSVIVPSMAMPMVTVTVIVIAIMIVIVTMTVIVTVIVAVFMMIVIVVIMIVAMTVAVMVTMTPLDIVGNLVVRMRVGVRVRVRLDRHCFHPFLLTVRVTVFAFMTMAVIMTVAVTVPVPMTVAVMVVSMTMSMTMSLMEYLSHRDVDQNTTARHDEHDFPVDVLWINQTVDRLIHEPDGQAPDQEHTEQRAHDLRPHISVRQFGRRLLLRHPQRDDRNHEPSAVRQ